jgi:hypothetical protein
MKPLRTDTFAVGDEVWWLVPTVMEFCRTWAPDTLKPTAIIAVRPIELEHVQRNAGHTQYVRVSPNYCPYSDEFSGAWFNPTGVKHHTETAP